MRVLILGGTTEASELARRLSGHARIAPTLSLAGRTAAPAQIDIQTRVGGFGGPEGLAQWLSDNGIHVVVDATHPFAARISANAVAATRMAAIPLLSLVRAPWSEKTGDRWIHAGDATAAAAALGPAPARVFLTIGRLELAPFRAVAQHSYLVRTIDAPAAGLLPPRAELLLQRGPFDEASETALLRERAIDIVVAKNSGGGATYAKIAAARALALPVVMIARPHKPSGIALGDVAAAQAWLEAFDQNHAHHHAKAPSERGV